MYKPDRWVVLKLPAGYKVLAGWSGGYLDGDSWRLNSGITKVDQDSDFYFFSGHSGSKYQCHKDSYGLTGITASVYQKIKEHAEKTNQICEIMPEDTNWMELEV